MNRNFEYGVCGLDAVTKYGGANIKIIAYPVEIQSVQMIQLLSAQGSSYKYLGLLFLVLCH